ncbi:MAG TPA: amidohydrolase family protein [Gemmatimonadaceae bacterium]|nr:amidohydrolase family protein [Gemmatimonadaceae bacterium]
MKSRSEVRGLRSAARWLAALFFVAASSAYAQRPPVGPGVRQFVRSDAAVIALTNARVIDGTGAPAREGQTLVIRDGRIAALGATGSVQVPAGAETIDLTGKSLLPGLVMLHEHLYYPTGPGMYGQLGLSFLRLYLAGGVTTMRTGGNLNGYVDFNLKRGIDSGVVAGPAMDATAPYLNGGPFPLRQVRILKGPDDARKMVAYWADEGATSFKAYMQITRAELGAAIEEAHKRGLKVTGHLCSVTFAEAAKLGIDNLEHGFIVASDFAPNKQADVCPSSRGFDALDPAGSVARELIRELVARKVAITSTLTVFETSVPGRPVPPGLEVLTPQLREQFERQHGAIARQTDTLRGAGLKKEMAMELAFSRAGGLLVAGTDPTGYGGVLPGYSNQRELELLVEAGFSPLEAIAIGTLNGAKYLGRDAQIGTIAVGKQADLMVVAGNPAAQIADVRNVEIVFRLGVAYDPKKLIESVKGSVGLY